MFRNETLKVRSADWTIARYIYFKDKLITTIYTTPTHNCQIASIGGINHTLRLLEKYEIPFKDFLKYIKKVIKPQFLLDIRKTEYPAYEETVKPHVTEIFSQEYLNGTGRLMVMILIK